MARYLLAWELGDGLGHASTLATIARALLARGHEVDLAWRDVDLGARVLGDAFHHPRLRFLPVPAWRRITGRPTPDGPAEPRTYADLLCHNGFLDEASLTGQLQAWRGLLAAVRPDVLVTDHAPVGLLAARQPGGPRTAQVGAGFFQPPSTRPFPSYRFWEAIEPDRSFEVEALRCCRQAQRACGVDESAWLQQLGDFLHTDLDLLLTWPELCHYGPQAGPRQRFIGPLPAQEAQDPPTWPEASSADERCLAYLHANYTALDQVLDLLIKSKLPTLLVIGNLPEPQRAKLHGHAHIRLSDRLVNVPQAISQARFVISHGGAGVIKSSLSLGKPLLMLPKHAEQWINSYRVCHLLAGVSLQVQELAEHGLASIQALASESHFHVHAQALARQHPPQAASQHLEAVCTLLEGLACA